MTLQEIDGLELIGQKYKKARLVVRFTSDNIGESISIADEERGIMLMVPFEEVKRQIIE